jgi:glutaredoxin-like protein NrdH
MIEVTVYTLPACVQCHSTKRFLDRNGITYTTVDLDTNPSSYDFVKSLGYSQAPVVVADGQHWSGFRHTQLTGLVQRIRGEKLHK